MIAFVLGKEAWKHHRHSSPADYYGHIHSFLECSKEALYMNGTGDRSFSIIRGASYYKTCTSMGKHIIVASPSSAAAENT